MTETTTEVVVESVTPYAASKLVNALLEENNIDKTLPPQMFYNYTTARVRKGKASYIELDEDNKILLTALSEWCEKYIAKQLANQK